MRTNSYSETSSETSSAGFESEEHYEDIEIASLGPLSLELKQSKYKKKEPEPSRGRDRRPRSRSRSGTRRNGDENLVPMRSRSRSLPRSASNIERSRSRSRTKRHDPRLLDEEEGQYTRSQSVLKGSRRSKRNDRRLFKQRFSADGFTNVKGNSFFEDANEWSNWTASFWILQIWGGLSVVVTQVPEVASYAFIAGVDPFLALQTTWIMNIFTAIIGGRPGMISSASAFGALVIRNLVKNHGVEYVFYAVILAGILQVAFATARLGQYLTLLPAAITIGLINAMCLLLYAAQTRYIKEIPTFETPTEDEDLINMPLVYFYGYDLPWIESMRSIRIFLVETLIAAVVCFLLPKITTLIPSTFAAIVIVTGLHFGFSQLMDWVSPTIDDYCGTAMPTLDIYKGMFASVYNLPPVFSIDVLLAVVPSGVALFCASVMETLVAVNVVDALTDEESSQDRTLLGQGIGNVVSGLMGGMSGGGMAFQSLLSIKSGSITSTSTFLAGAYLLLIMLFAYPAISIVPLGAVAGVTLFLIFNMIQWAPLLAVIIHLVPTRLILRIPSNLRLPRSDIIAAVVSTCIALLGDIYILAGFVIGALCYAFDAISHAIICSNYDENLTLTQLRVPPTDYEQSATLRNRK